MRLLLLAITLVLPVWAAAQQENPAAVYEFDSRSQEVRFQNLLEELRCPKCQNQNIIDSNAPISKDMRERVYLMMQEGASNEEITNSLVARFGEFVRYKPKLESRTLLLWATPVLAVLIGVLVVGGVFIRSRRHGAQAAELSDEEREKASRALSNYDSDASR
ncbi:cytochrome c-type biogenesis protein [Marinobacter sp.]|uniref:cytochrome c-type biogenesis protein n=1 Tax=Marinobacter sp. TaxID=50741 RepID=UPI002B49C620|nr:cytochrome c-type biogenesis protein [Marinobacter sp.]HKK55706.1 cytochrome c-type biogenesis protein [Marinobacter sp.]